MRKCCVFAKVSYFEIVATEGSVMATFVQNKDQSGSRYIMYIGVSIVMGDPPIRWMVYGTSIYKWMMVPEI